MNELSLTDELVLLGLMGGREEGLSPSEVTKNLKGFPSEQTLEIEPSFSRLRDAGHVEEMPRVKRQRSSRWRLRSSGREALMTRLGSLSARGKRWKQQAMRALIAVHTLRLPPETAAACAKDENFLPAYFLAGRLGESFGPSVTAQSLAEQSAAAALGIPNGKPETIWRRLCERVITPEPGAQDPADSISFAEQVNQAARTAPDGWFGPRKLFINRACSAWQRSTGRSVDLPVFKSQLLSGLRAGHLGLTRADFTVSLDPADLAESEIRDGDETFHFLTSERAASHE